MVSSSSSSSHECYYTILGVKQSATIDEIKANFRKLCMEYHPDVAATKATTSGTHSINQERFKKITVAAGVLTNPKKRVQYDFEQKQEQLYRKASAASSSSSYDYYSYYYNQQQQTSSQYTSSYADYIHARRAVRQQEQRARARAQARAGGTGGGFRMYSTMIHPRYAFILGPMVFFTTVTIYQFLIGSNSSRWSNSHITTNASTSTAFISHNNNNDSLVQAWMNPNTNQYETPAPWDPMYQRLNPPLVFVPREQVKARTR